MSRVSSKHECYRSKRRIIRDVWTVLNIKELHWGTKRAVLKNAIWAWTCFEGKLQCEWWTEAALRARHGGAAIDLQHEHVVPLKVLYEMFRTLKHPTRKRVRKLFEQLAIGVVMTRSEHAELNKTLRDKMPGKLDPDGEWTVHDIWSRYHGRIKLVRNPDSAAVVNGTTLDDDT